MNEDKDTRQQAEEDAQEDLELSDEDAGKVGGGQKINDLSIPKLIDKASP
jgi:hypothetical protein